MPNRPIGAGEHHAAGDDERQPDDQGDESVGGADRLLGVGTRDGAGGAFHRYLPRKTTAPQRRPSLSK